MRERGSVRCKTGVAPRTYSLSLQQYRGTSTIHRCRVIESRFPPRLNASSRLSWALLILVFCVFCPSAPQFGVFARELFFPSVRAFEGLQIFMRACACRHHSTSHPAHGWYVLSAFSIFINVYCKFTHFCWISCVPLSTSSIFGVASPFFGKKLNF